MAIVAWRSGLAFHIFRARVINVDTPIEKAQAPEAQALNCESLKISMHNVIRPPLILNPNQSLQIIEQGARSDCAGGDDGQRVIGPMRYIRVGKTVGHAQD
jgi:hypothetical protein